MVEQAHSQGCCNCGCSNRGQHYDGKVDEFLGAAAIPKTPDHGGMGANRWQWLPTLTGFLYSGNCCRLNHLLSEINCWQDHFIPPN